MASFLLGGTRVSKPNTKMMAPSKLVLTRLVLRLHEPLFHVSQQKHANVLWAEPAYHFSLHHIMTQTVYTLQN